jgi:YjbE family integral membrane protein
VLAGDNAVVIALAVRKLPPRQRWVGIALGSAVAVVLRVGLTFVAAQVLTLNYVKLVGGVLILWIAVKLLVDNTGEKEHGKEAGGLWQAVWLILVADITMSLDNVLAVAGAAREHPVVLIFGLSLSILMMGVAARFIAGLLHQYRWIAYLGLVVILYVAFGMVFRGAEELRPVVSAVAGLN